MKLQWVTIQVNNMNKSLDFYQKIIGLNLKMRQKISEEAEIAFLGEGETPLELVYSSNEQSTHSKNISIAFEVESVDKSINEFKKIGIEIFEGPIQPMPTIKFFYILDPNGVKIQLVENVKLNI